MTQARSSKVGEERLEGTGGLGIFVRSWRPETKARGVVAVVPDLSRGLCTFRQCVECVVETLLRTRQQVAVAVEREAH